MEGGIQNWQIAQGQSGLTYFANNKGLLVFDGTYWSNYALPNKTIVRSVAISKNQDIFVGGQNEFGFFSPNDSAQLVYNDLKNHLPPDAQSFDDVWSIAILGPNHFFRVRHKIFHFLEKKVVVHEDGNWEFMDTCQGRLYAQELTKGLMLYENGIFSSLPEGNKLSGSVQITGFYAISADSMIIATALDGLFLKANNGFTPFLPSLRNDISKGGINAVKQLTNGFLAIGTRNHGVYIVESQGDVSHHYHVASALRDSGTCSVPDCGYLPRR